MANETLIPIGKITVGAAGAASVTFSSIPQTGYTDLKIVCSTRQTGAATTASMNFTFNGSSTGFTYRALQGSGSSAASFSGSTGYFGQGDAASATASTFGNAEFLIPNYTSSNYKSISADTVDENNATTAYAQMTAVLWSNTAAINSISLVSGNGNWAQYSTFSLYGIAAFGTTSTNAPKALGGDIIQTDGTYWYHAFISSGTFTPNRTISCDVLVVAGGGGGGGYSGFGNAGGGGGGGQVRSFTSQSLSTTSYTVTVGAGGTTQTTGSGTSGVASQFGSLAAATPGVGGTKDAYPATTNGGASGSGQSGAYSNNSAGGGGGGDTAVGKSGAINADGTSQGTYSGGGGGAGNSSFSSWGSATGTGQNVSGTYWYAGGGGGAAYYVYSTGSGANGGNGGGGRGADYNGANYSSGTANTGGGGGGINYNVSATVNGGSGIVIVRYAV